MNDNELMNRRRFFKKTAKEMLPMLGAFVAAPTVIMSTLTSCSCDGCEATCKDDCEGTCQFNCSSSSGSGCSDCSSSCSGSSISTLCSSCANDCSSSCKDSCEGQATGKPAKGNIDEQEYIDLGLSVLWATKNIGASYPEELGDSFTFAYNEYDSYEANKEAFNQRNFKDGESICGTNLDIARQKWGSKWRLPSHDEMRELTENCIVELVSENEVRLTSKKNGNSIIFKCNKFFSYGYWSGDVKMSSENKQLGAWILNIEPSDKMDISPYYIGFFFNLKYNARVLNLVRPVSERNNGNVSTCNGSCTANCANSCFGICKNKCSGSCKEKCDNSCSGSCKEDCSSGCNTTCTRTCADSCSNNCSSKCTATCADSCKALTSQYCSNCANSCSSGCTKTCADSCKAQTSQGCDGCSNTCKTGCGRQCYWSCGGSCDKQCEGYCITGCQGYSRGSCSGTCIGSCSTQCSSSCRSYCYSSCTSMGVSGT